jgi:hypothetical protein
MERVCKVEVHMDIFCYLSDGVIIRITAEGKDLRVSMRSEALVWVGVQ